VTGLASLQSATAHDLSFLSQAKWQAQLGTTLAACVVVAPGFQAAAQARGDCLVVDEPYLYYARLSQWWARRQAEASGLAAEPLVHPSAVVAASAHVHPSAQIGPLCVVEAGAVIGAHTRLMARVTVARDCVLGERCIVQPGAVIGGDGFGFAPSAEGWIKIEQLGAVRIGNDVEIGANTCIDRGALDDTVIEDGVKLDNLIQIAHNCRIGRNTAIAGCVGIAGSTIIGANCTVGGQAGFTGHLTLVEGVHISARTLVTRSISKPGRYSGSFPMDEHQAWEKNAATLRQLAGLRDRIKTLEAQAKMA
jgi:UDP-3-O-[3-hydroxymyristoyl] glucosamine N-acyltransferase